MKGTFFNMAKKRKEKTKIDQIVEKGLKKLDKVYKTKLRKYSKEAPYIDNFKVDSCLRTLN